MRPDGQCCEAVSFWPGVTLCVVTSCGKVSVDAARGVARKRGPAWNYGQGWVQNCFLQEFDTLHLGSGGEETVEIAQSRGPALERSPGERGGCEGC